MSSIKEKLTSMFSKVMAGTVTREEGTMLLNHLVKEDKAGTLSELAELIVTPPSGVFPKTVLHTIALARNKAFNNLLISCLEHKNEDVVVMAAQELARLRTEESSRVLHEHLSSEAYYVRKASATALAEVFGPDGIKILSEHILTHPEPFYRITSANAMLRAGKKGREALLEILHAGNTAGVATAAEALLAAGDVLTDEDVPKVFSALMEAGDRKDTASIIELLKVIASLKGRASRYRGFIHAFKDYPAEQVGTLAASTLEKIDPGS